MLHIILAPIGQKVSEGKSCATWPLTKDAMANNEIIARTSRENRTSLRTMDLKDSSKESPKLNFGQVFSLDDIMNKLII